MTLFELYNSHDRLVSDKWLSYLQEYENIFCNYKSFSLDLLEIGVQNGGSLEIWAKYFSSDSRIIGCDINPACEELIFELENIDVVVGSIIDPAVQKRIFELTESFDIIIDDGSHVSSDIVNAFCSLFSRVKPGGIYIVEDLHCSYWSQWGGGLYESKSAIVFFKQIVDIINYEHWGVEVSRSAFLKCFAEAGALLDSVLSEIHSIKFNNSMCSIVKRPADENLLGKRLVAGQIEPVCCVKQSDGKYSSTPEQSSEHIRYSIDELRDKKTPKL